ncbi:MAG: hypothetical protein WA937_04870 [Flavobacteriales bacterium]
MNSRILMMASATVMSAFGLVLSFAPEEAMAYFRQPTAGAVPVLLQLTGALYLGFAFMNWTAKGSVLGGIYGRASCSALRSSGIPVIRKELPEGVAFERSAYLRLPCSPGSSSAQAWPSLARALSLRVRASRAAAPRIPLPLWKPSAGLNLGSLINLMP